MLTGMFKKKSVLSQGEPRDAAQNFDMYHGIDVYSGIACYCDNTAFVSKNGKNHGKIVMLNTGMSILT